MDSAAAAPESQLDPTHQGSVISQGRDGHGEQQVSSGTAYGGALGPSSPGQYQTQAMNTQPSTPQTGVHPPHQTPVPLPQIPAHATSARPSQYMQPHQPGFVSGYAGGYSQPPTAMRYQQVGNPGTPGYNVAQSSRNTAPQSQTGHHNNAYNPPRPPEVYTLPDSTNEAVPSHIRTQLQCDKVGRVLFFTAPPLDRPHHQLSPEDSGLGHSLRYLAGQREWRVERENKRKARDQIRSQSTSKRTEPSVDMIDGELAEEARGAVVQWFSQIGQETEKWRQETGLSH